MVSWGVLVLLGLVVWVVTYGPPETTRDIPKEDTGFAELTALFDKPASLPDRTIRPR